MPEDKKRARPILLVICGLIGTGKSTLAAALSGITGFELLRSDEVRKKMAGLDMKTHSYEPFGKGIYSDEFFDATYDALFQEAEQRIGKGRGVIIDASFKKEKYRSRAKDMAESLKVPFLLIECRCPDEIIKQRLIKREREGEDISDGRWPVFLEQKNNFEDITEISKKEHLIIDTGKALDDNIEEILRVIDW